MACNISGRPQKSRIWWMQWMTDSRSNAWHDRNSSGNNFNSSSNDSSDDGRGTRNCQKKTIRKILVDDLGKWKNSGRSVSHSLTDEQRALIQDYWVFGLRPSSGIKKKGGGGNTTFRKLDLFPSSSEGAGDTYSFGPSIIPAPSPENRNRSIFRTVVFFCFLEYRTMDKVQKTQ
jgi:hypothetical protein